MYTHSGMSEITRWIRELLELASVHSQILLDHSEHRPTKKLKNDINILYGGSIPKPLSPPPPPQLPPPPQPPVQTIVTPQPVIMEPRQTSPSNSVVVTGSPTSILASFNQYCAQKKLQVDWHANFDGRPHSGRWHIKCIGTKFQAERSNCIT